MPIAGNRGWRGVTGDRRGIVIQNEARSLYPRFGRNGRTAGQVEHEGLSGQFDCRKARRWVSQKLG